MKKNYTLEELNDMNFTGYHNVIINNMFEGCYDTIEDVNAACTKWEFDDKQLDIINKYAKIVFGL